MSNNSPRKLNVLQFICPTGFYGAERWILALVKNLPKDEVNCDLAVTLEDNSRDLILVKKYKEGYGDTFEIPMSNRFDLSVIRKLVTLIKKRNIDIIHTHGYKSDILGVIAARMAGIKSVVTPHGFENAKDWKLKLYIWLGCKAMANADAVAPLSPKLITDSINNGVNPKKINYIQNGVDLSEVEAQRKKPTTMPALRRIGFIGQMISRKNIIDILKIFDSLAVKRNDIELVLLGDGDERDKLESFATQLKSHENIHFLGFRLDRLEYLQSFDLFVMTSTLEGIPRCLMEACAMGIPVAAYNISGIDQIIEHKKTGLLAPPGQKNILQSYWETLLDNSDQASKLAENAKVFVHEHYSATRMAEEYQTLFRNLLG